MTVISEVALKELIKELENSPTELDLINAVAIGYFENPSMLTDDEDLKHFELAYKTQKTVKSMHNLAWYLYFEWGEKERACEIQKECIQLNPKSYFPYYQYAYMLIDQKRFKDAIPFLEKASKIENRRDIIHNLGCCHFHVQNYQRAFQLFECVTQIEDIENRSFFNLALAAFKTNKLDQLESIAQRLFVEIEMNHHKAVSGYEVGLLFYLLKNYQLATACLFKQGIEGIDLFEWQELSYSLYMTDKKTWQNKITPSIDERVALLKEIESGHEDWNGYTTKEKRERIIELKSEIELIEKTLFKGMTKLKLDLSESIFVEYCGCLLFDCSRHGNRKGDK